MAKRNIRIRTSSEISFVPEVFCASYNEPMPIDPPNTSYLTAMPELRTRLSNVVSKEEHSESRWKPLMGTPSKPPVPPNILVPDPSPIRDVADDESPRMLTPSSRGSFIHRRRQGEYVPRPPVWKIYDLPIHSHSLSNELEDTDTDIDTETCESDEDVFTDLKSRNVSYMRPAEISVAGQIRKMAEIFGETPDLVNMTEPADHIVAQMPSTADPRENRITAQNSIVLHQGSDHPNLQKNGDKLLGITLNDVVWQSRLTRSGGDCSAKSNSLIVPYGNAATPHQEPTITLGANPKNQEFLDSCSTAIVGLEAHPLSVYQIPQVSLDFTHSQISNIKSCTDVQQPKEIEDPPMSGYLVKFIGDTTFSAGQIDGQSELDDKDDFMIAIIYNDGWGTFIQRNLGRKLTCIANTTSKGSSYKAEDATVEVVYDETLFCFLPLCSVTAIVENRFYRKAKLFAEATEACFKGGEIRPPPRTHSMAAEVEAKGKGVVVISEAVFESFNCRCENPRSYSKLPVHISGFRHNPSVSSKINAFGQGLSAELNRFGVKQKVEKKKETWLQRSHGQNLFFTRGKDMTLQQHAQAKTHDANPKSVHEHGMQHPMGHEEYKAFKKAADEILQQRLEQRQREKEGQGVEEEAERAQRETQMTKEQVYLDGKGDTPELLRMVSEWLQHPGHDAGEGPPCMVADLASDQKPRDGTAIQSLNVQQLSISTSNNRTVVSWRKIPQENADIRPDDCKSKKGQGHPETAKENKSFPIGSIGKSIRGSLRGVRSKLSLSRGRNPPGPLSVSMAPMVKPNGLPTISNNYSEEDGASP